MYLILESGSKAGACEAIQVLWLWQEVSLLKTCSQVLRASVVAGRVHMAAPAQRAVSGARRERNSNKHKRLFLPNEPGGLIVSASSAACTLPPYSLAQKISCHTHARGAAGVVGHQYVLTRALSIASTVYGHTTVLIG